MGTTYYGCKYYPTVTGGFFHLLSTGLIPQFYCETKTATVNGVKCTVYRLFPNADIALIVANDNCQLMGIGTFQTPSFISGVNYTSSTINSNSNSYITWYYNSDGILMYNFRCGYGEINDIYLYVDYSNFGNYKFVSVKAGMSRYNMFNNSFITIKVDNTNNIVIDTDYILVSLQSYPLLNYIANNSVQGIACTPIVQSKFFAPMKMPLIKHFIGTYSIGQIIDGFYIVCPASSRLPEYDSPAFTEFIGVKI